MKKVAGQLLEEKYGKVQKFVLLHPQAKIWTRSEPHSTSALQEGSSPLFRLLLATGQAGTYLHVPRVAFSLFSLFAHSSFITSSNPSYFTHDHVLGAPCKTEPDASPYFGLWMQENELSRTFPYFPSSK